jgi:hypothetical protein
LVSFKSIRTQRKHFESSTNSFNITLRSIHLKNDNSQNLDNTPRAFAIFFIY